MRTVSCDAPFIFMTDHYQYTLEQILNTGNYRRLPQARQEAADFSSNDYLGLSKNCQVIEAAYHVGFQYGIGATGSRLLSGNYPLIEELETRIAQDKNCQAALIFSSGHQANLSVLSTLLADQKALVFFDKLNHASLYQAIQTIDCKLIRYRSCDMDHLAELLKKHQHDPSPKWIVSETVFGMDGKKCPLQPIINFAETYGAWLYLDEAHATGLYGPQGYGISTCQPLPKKTIIMGTFSKALGNSGAYIACPTLIKEFLINRAAGFIYSTAPSPMIIGGILKAWQLLPTLDPVRHRIHNLADYIRRHISNLDVMGSKTNIIPIIIGDPVKTLDLKDRLSNNSINVSAIRSPTVPKGTDRLRIAINAQHTQNDIDHLIESLVS
jgi:8-amino-7-oxononanoate synthase